LLPVRARKGSTSGPSSGFINAHGSSRTALVCLRPRSGTWLLAWAALGHSAWRPTTPRPRIRHGGVNSTDSLWRHHHVATTSNRSNRASAALLEPGGSGGPQPPEWQRQRLLDRLRNPPNYRGYRRQCLHDCSIAYGWEYTHFREYGDLYG